MSLKRIGFIIFLVLVAAVYLFNRQDVTFTKQDALEIKSVSASGIEISSVIHLNNPNLLSVTITRIHEKFFINRFPIGELDFPLSQGIAGRKETEFPLSIRCSRDDYDRAVKGDSLKSTISIAIDGQVDYQRLIGAGTAKGQQTIEYNP